MKKKVRVVGFDDSFKGDDCYLVGCVTESRYVEGFMVEKISVDGFDATEKIVKMISKSKFREQLKCVFLSGITFGGFNVVDIEEVYKKTGVPVVVIMRKKPNMERIREAIKNVSMPEIRMKFFERAGEIYELGNLFVQIKGCDLDFAEEVIKETTAKGNVPEALRIAHLVASAIIHGESRGKV
ncbi:DUF99 family protein [Ferroglobus sp.]|uniref:endonuclease dU n=1 Tax=Ferroglobus sp. TaxID=2614230 RepID=UPI0025BD89ED|nr:DUF99 family protein [Ferroglobus sp.]